MANACSESGGEDPSLKKEGKEATQENTVNTPEPDSTTSHILRRLEELFALQEEAAEAQQIVRNTKEEAKDALQQYIAAHKKYTETTRALHEQKTREQNLQQVLRRRLLSYKDMIRRLIKDHSPQIVDFHEDLQRILAKLTPSIFAAASQEIHDVIEKIVLLTDGGVSTIPDIQRNRRLQTGTESLREKRKRAFFAREKEIAEARSSSAGPEDEKTEELSKIPASHKRKSEKNSEKRETVPVHIRWMIRRDMPEVLQAERLSFEQAWTEEDFLRCLRQRNCIGMVSEHEGRVAGYMIYELHKSKLHIITFAVHPEWRRANIGTQMVGKLMSKLSSHRRTRITVEVRETNLQAQLFFSTCEFRGTRVLRNFYEDTDEDAILMEYRFSSAMEDCEERSE